MEPIKNIFEKLKPLPLPGVTAVPKKGGINSPFNNAVGQVCELMNDNRFGYWCGRLRKFAPQEIHAMLSIARHDGKNPAAYFNYLVKNRQAELSTQVVDNKAKGV